MNLFCQGSADHSKCPDRQPRPDGPPDGHDLDPPDHGGHRVQVLAHRGEHGQSHHKQMIILLCPGLSDQVTITISITIDKTPAQLSTVKGKITTIEFSHFDINIFNISRRCLCLLMPALCLKLLLHINIY